MSHRFVVLIFLIAFQKTVFTFQYRKLIKTDGSDSFPDDFPYAVSSFVKESCSRDHFPEIPICIPDHLKYRMEMYPPNFGCQTSEYGDSMIICNRSDWTYIHSDEIPAWDLLYLRLDVPSISAIDKKTLSGMSVAYIEIQTSNSLTFVHQDAFEGISNVQVLKMNRADFSKIGNDLQFSFFSKFKHLKSLKRLILTNNNLIFNKVDVDRKSSDSILQELSYLSLEGNNLVRLEKNVFWELRDSPIEELNLKNCHLASIDSEAFKHLKKIKHIDFHKNTKLVSINAFIENRPFCDSMFNVNVLSMESLSLSSMEMFMLPKCTSYLFKKRLKYLNLSGNTYFKLGLMERAFHIFYTFPPMENLQVLILDSSYINEIKDFVFERLEKLQHLSLKNNRLSTIFDGMLLPTLESLDLSDQCTQEHCDYKEFNLVPEIFNHNNMTNLKYLNLSNLKLKTIETSDLSGLTGLKGQFTPGTKSVKYIWDMDSNNYY